MAAVHPFAAGVPRRVALAPVPSPAASGKKRPRVAPARDSLTVVGEMMSSQEILMKKRLASEFDVFRGLMKKTELISRGAPTAGKKQQSKPAEETLGKKRKISALVEQKPKQQEIVILQPPRMSPEERKQLTRRLSSLSGEVPGYIGEFLQKQFGDADADECEIEINMDAVEDSVLFELKTRLDKFAVESKDGKCGGAPTDGKKELVLASKQRPKPVEDGGNTTSAKRRKISSLVEQKPEQKDVKVVQESKDSKLGKESNKGDKIAEKNKDGKLVEESKDGKVENKDGNGKVTDTSEESLSEPAPAVVSAQEKKAEAVKHAAARAIYMPGLIYRANMRRELMEMERALALLPPAESTVHPWELQRLCIKEYGRPSVMRHIGLVLKA